MKNQESEIHDQTKEFIQAARKLHDEGKEWLYRHEIGLQMSRNSVENNTAGMTRYETACRALGRVGVKIGLSRASYMQRAIEPISDRLEEEGRLEVEWEAHQLQRDGYPQMRLYRLSEEAG